MLTIANEHIEASISPRGGEMVSLRHRRAGEVLWQGDKGIWADHSPILFPIVGRARDDMVAIGGRRYPLGPHGLAKTADFAVERQEADRLRLALEGDPAWPFRFRLVLDYAVAGEELTLAMTAENREAERAMPVNLGFHPGFAWPLPGAPGKAGHRVLFEKAEDVAVRRLNAERLLAVRPDWRFTGDALALHEELFVPSAMILPGLSSRSVTLTGPTSTRIAVGFDTPVLALWMRGGGDYICIEPWWAAPQAEDEHGDYADQRGVALVPPGGSHGIGMTIGVTVDGASGSVSLPL